MQDVEGMQSTIYYLQQQLREAKETISRLESGEGGECKEEVEDTKEVKQEAPAELEEVEGGGERTGEEAVSGDRTESPPAGEGSLERVEDRSEEESEGLRGGKRGGGSPGTPGRRGRGRGRGRAASKVEEQGGFLLPPLALDSLFDVRHGIQYSTSIVRVQ